MKKVDDFVKKDKTGLLQMDNTMKPKKFTDFLKAPSVLEKMKSKGKDKPLKKEKLSDFDRLNENEDVQIEPIEESDNVQAQPSEFWITGKDLSGNITEAPEGEVAGFDFELGDMVSSDGILIPYDQYNNKDAAQDEEVVKSTEDGFKTDHELPDTQNEETKPVEEKVVEPFIKEGDPPTDKLTKSIKPVKECDTGGGSEVLQADRVIVEPEVQDDIIQPSIDDLYADEKYPPNFRRNKRMGRERQRMTSSDYDFEDRNESEEVFESYLNWDKETLKDFYGDHNFDGKKVNEQYIDDNLQDDVGGFFYLSELNSFDRRMAHQAILAITYGISNKININTQSVRFIPSSEDSSQWVITFTGNVIIRGSDEQDEQDRQSQELIDDFRSNSFEKGPGAEYLQISAEYLEDAQISVTARGGYDV